MVRRRRQIGVEIRVASREIGDRQRGERSRAEYRIVLDLRRAVVVEAEVAEVRRRMACNAVAGMRGTRIGGLGKERLEALQLCGAERELLALLQTKFGLAIGRARRRVGFAHEYRLVDSVDQPKQTL